MVVPRALGSLAYLSLLIGLLVGVYFEAFLAFVVLIVARIVAAVVVWSRPYSNKRAAPHE